MITQKAWDRAMEQWHETTEENMPDEAVLVSLDGGHEMQVLSQHWLHSDKVWGTGYDEVYHHIEGTWWRHLPKGPKE